MKTQVFLLTQINSHRCALRVTWPHQLSQCLSDHSLYSFRLSLSYSSCARVFTPSLSMNSCSTVAFIWSPRQLLQSDTGVPHFALDPLTYRCLLSPSPAADFAEPRPPRHSNIAQKVGLYIISLTHSYQNTYNIYIISHFSICIETIMQFCLNSIISQHLTDCMNINAATRVEMQSSTSNQIKSLLLSHHHSTSALVSEILMSVLQTVQKKTTTTIYIWTDSAKKQQQFTYGQTVQKKQQTIYIWTDSAKKQQQQFTYGQTVQKNNKQFTYGQTVQKKKKKKFTYGQTVQKSCTGAFTVLQTVQKNNNNLHMDSTYLQTVQKTMCKIHIHILSTHSVL